MFGIKSIACEYDLRGRKTYEGGATYPVRYEYDAFGNKTSMTTYRAEPVGRPAPWPPQGDITRWLYDEASGLVTNKIYADSLGPLYSYSADGKLVSRTWARGIVTTYAYDCWGNLTNTVYSDSTPAISIRYDAMGRQLEVHDAAGVTTFAYDNFGSCTNETVVGVAGTNTIVRCWDPFGRTLGYVLEGHDVPGAPGETRRTTIGYDPLSGRISSMLAAGSTNEFRWTYLPGSDLKESLTYPNGDVVRWEYEPQRDLLTLVSNATHSTFRYTYDAAGRRVSKNDERYGYNARGELTLVTNIVDGTVFAYTYDDIGNRLSSCEFGTNATYTANYLNQYTEIIRGGIVEHQQFDADGNQTDITTGTGRWLVEYNGENRPVRWTRPADGKMIEMSYDRMGRRVKSGEETFVYDGYLNIGTTIWDPTEPIATRPLVWLAEDVPAYYFHDGNKNVAEMVSLDVHVAGLRYEYMPYGSCVEPTNLLYFAQIDTARYNPFRFSSEFYDSFVGMVYYNYRNYDVHVGRWTGRDQVYEMGGGNLYTYVGNDPLRYVDRHGLFIIRSNTPGVSPPGGWPDPADMALTVADFRIVHEKQIGCGLGKIGYQVVFDKSDTIVDIYFRLTATLQHFKDELDHVDCAKSYDDALNTFKENVEKICDCPDRAIDALNRLKKARDAAHEAMKKCNAALDAPGGPHGH